MTLKVRLFHFVKGSVLMPGGQRGNQCDRPDAHRVNGQEIRNTACVASRVLRPSTNNSEWVTQVQRQIEIKKRKKKTALRMIRSATCNNHQGQSSYRAAGNGKNERGRVGGRKEGNHNVGAGICSTDSKRHHEKYKKYL